MKELMRLDKYLTEMGQGTRSQIKEMARKGRITVNGVTEKKSDRKISPSSDAVAVDGRIVAYAEYEYYMLHKPEGVVSATEDRRHRTVLDLITGRMRDDLFPVGRLDIDTEGLLLITNDGDLAHRLLSPKKHVDKVYYAKIEGMLPEDAKERMAAGLTLSDGTETLPADLEIVRRVRRGGCGELSEIRLTIHEGKFHQVKRMFQSVGKKVSYLKRLSMGSLHLDETLSPGAWRELTLEEITKLKEETT